MLTLMAVLALAACGSGADDAASGGGASPSPGSDDSFKRGYALASDAVVAKAQSAVLLAAGTPGLALADVPDAWSYTFFSPDNQHLYSIDVEHGKAGPVKDLGAAQKKVTLGASVDPESIKVGAAQAVAKARAFGEESGAVPPNVVVGGVFTSLPGGATAGYKLGVWQVVFATGTDLKDAQRYEVEMMTGKVAKVKK